MVIHILEFNYTKNANIVRMLNDNLLNIIACTKPEGIGFNYMY